MTHFTSEHKKPKVEYERNGFKIESVQCVKDIGITIASRLKVSQKCKDAARKANRMLYFINKKVSCKNKTYNTTTLYQLSQTPSEIAVQFWSPYPAKDIAKLKTVQRRATKMITALHN